MPNTPARLGKGMTVWYATPECTPEQRAQAAALLGALGHELEVDDEKMVAMATAVSGTGPTYVFLVMEALIDAAVHLGFPRHIAHDLVIETLEGSTRVRQAVRDAPGRAPEHGHVARRDVGRGPPRARVRPAPDRAVRGGLGGLPPDRGARRSAGGFGLDAAGTTADREEMKAARLDPSPSGGRALAASAPSTCVLPNATCGSMSKRSGIGCNHHAGPPRRRGLALPGAAPSTPVARTGRWPSTLDTSPIGLSWPSTT